MAPPAARRFILSLCLPFPPHLQGSAEEHNLESDTSERLQLGLLGLAGAALGVHVLHSECGSVS